MKVTTRWNTGNDDRAGWQLMYNVCETMSGGWSWLEFTDTKDILAVLTQKLNLKHDPEPDLNLNLLLTSSYPLNVFRHADSKIGQQLSDCRVVQRPIRVDVLYGCEQRFQG